MVESKYIIIAVLWTLYYALHSSLSSDALKLFLQKQGFSLNKWRTIYSFVSVLGLFAIFYQMATIEDKLLWQANSITKIVSMVFTTYGLLLIRVVFRHQSLRGFLSKDDRFNENEQLLSENIYSKVRHPLYSATILVFIGMFLFIPKTITAIALMTTLLYLLIGISLEEKKLIKKFGQSYLEYKKRVPALVPRIWSQ